MSDLAGLLRLEASRRADIEQRQDEIEQLARGRAAIVTDIVAAAGSLQKAADLLGLSKSTVAKITAEHARNAGRAVRRSRT